MEVTNDSQTRWIGAFKLFAEFPTIKRGFDIVLYAFLVINMFAVFHRDDVIKAVNANV